MTCQGECAGLVGDTDGPITRSWATGDVDGGALVGDGVGGLVGSSYAVADCYATGDVNGHTYVGGLVGTVDASYYLVRSYATGTATGTDEVGGLVGALGFSTGGAMLNDSFATGPVTGASATGQVSLLVGVIIAPSTQIDNYVVATATCTNTAGTCNGAGTVVPTGARNVYVADFFTNLVSKISQLGSGRLTVS